MASVTIKGVCHEFEGEWVEGFPWQRFGLYNTYVLIRPDGAVSEIPAHAGELVPGSTEDLLEFLNRLGPDGYLTPPVPMTLELDVTYRCASNDCGGACFSAGYRATAPGASIPVELASEIIASFADRGGRILRFDGGGDPLAHPQVRTGELVECASRLGLKTTILTSGDLLSRCSLERFVEAGCFVRVSLNAATERIRRQFHGNEIPLSEITAAIESLATQFREAGSDVPVGATFLLGRENYREVLECAKMAREIGVGHFSVRRILGPSSLRQDLSDSQEGELHDLLNEVKAMHSIAFRVAVPWRSLGEPDLNPAAGDFHATQCWQTTFKTVIEPDTKGFRVQLCGRYRGGGLGQLVQLPPLCTGDTGGSWASAWASSFAAYPISRQMLPRTCVSCIDRGFILLMERIIGFAGHQYAGLRILHLNKPATAAGSVCA